MAQTMDFINLMTYDMHGSWEKSADHLAPLFKRPWETKDNNVDYIVNYYIRNGFPASKINLGIPLYGQSWLLASNDILPPAPTAGIGPAGPITNQAGILAYSEICQNIRNKGWKTYQDPSYLTGPFAYSPSAPVQWVGYDDVPFSIRKAKYALAMGLGGLMVWDMSQDDFGNTCGGGVNPIMTAIAQTINKSSGRPSGFIRPAALPPRPTATTTPNTPPLMMQYPTGSSKSLHFTHEIDSILINKLYALAAFVCPLPNGLFADRSSCSSYVNCNGGKPFKMSCSAGLFFNPSTANCDWPANVPTCSRA